MILAAKIIIVLIGIAAVMAIAFWLLDKCF
jgi:uncharacterized membrane protein YuzA (DUF378 family)